LRVPDIAGNSAEILNYFGNSFFGLYYFQFSRFVIKICKIAWVSSQSD
jgi:hypothetical protein